MASQHVWISPLEMILEVPATRASRVFCIESFFTIGGLLDEINRGMIDQIQRYLSLPDSELPGECENSRHQIIGR